ncbi:MAG TPA: ATP synthase F0 subunit B [Bacteroidetes bacterium]|nr:ATP synthase F0 subunit B [Bacteroidota bacterium]
MPAFLSFDPGLVIWTLINFSIFALIIGKFGWKPMRDAIASRESSIREAITAAERANREAQDLIRENQERLAKAQRETMEIVKEGRNQAENIIRKASEEAEHVKQQKLAEAQREIDRQKDEAIQVLRNEVASLVVGATEKLIGRSLDGEDHKRIVESYVNELSKN